MKDHYAVLGIEADASLAEVKSAYRKSAARFHPDKNSAPDAPAKFREVQEAYELLSDATKRQAYDENRRRGLLENPLESALGIWKNYIHKVLQ
jgi:DnaJ-class molecular chaperone